MISVIVPVYNVEAYLSRCVDSIISQSFSDLEIILVDDGSTDASGEICDGYAANDSRVKVIHKANGGLSDARNAGIGIANGEYITFIDSDDFILPEYFSYLHKLIADANADMAVCQFIAVDENDRRLSSGGVEVDKTIKGNENCMAAFLADTAIDTTAWRKLYRTSLFTDSGIRYPVGRYHEDAFTTYLIIALCDTIAIGSQPLYAYRQRSGSIVNSYFSPKHFDLVQASLERYEFISKRYPKLSPSAANGIIYAANICAMRMAWAKADSTPYLPVLKPIYRQHLRSYMRSNSRTASKIFAIAARVNLRMLIATLRQFF